MKSLDDSVELCTQELTFNPSFYPSLVRMPMARRLNSLAGRLPSRMRGVATVTCSIYRGGYRRNIWKSGGSRLSVCPWQEIRWLPVVRMPMAWLSERLGQRFVIDDRPGATS